MNPSAVELGSATGSLRTIPIRNLDLTRNPNRFRGSAIKIKITIKFTNVPGTPVSIVVLPNRDLKRLASSSKVERKL
jgi:hypothetical protein